jgi:hypothetical protein
MRIPLGCHHTSNAKDSGGARAAFQRRSHHPACTPKHVRRSQRCPQMGVPSRTTLAVGAAPRVARRQGKLWGGERCAAAP